MKNKGNQAKSITERKTGKKNSIDWDMHTWRTKRHCIYTSNYIIYI